MSEWKTIDSAPKDGAILGYWGDNSKWPCGEWSYGVMKWLGDEWVEVETCDAYLSLPTHWQPLPDPPK